LDYYFIGEAELATAFRFVGVGASAVASPEEARAAFRRVTRGAVDGIALPAAADCRVLVLTEDVADALGEELSDWQLSGEYPLVVELPGLLGRTPGRRTLIDAIRDAIGVHV
jgi:V/A-type H+-transporting ATPase subunit F